MSSKLSTLLLKEVRFLFRRVEGPLSAFFFCFLVVLIVQLGFSSEGGASFKLVHPLLWVAVFFGGMLRMGQTFDTENKLGILDALRVVPGIAVPLFLSKFLTNLFFVLVLEVFSFGMILFFFNPEGVISYLKHVWLLTLLSTAGFVCVGTTFSTMVIGHRKREMLLAIIGYPILIPLVVGVMKGPVFGLDGSVLMLPDFWIKILVAFDIIYLVTSIMVFENLLKA